jgi:hypothetical protein
MPPVQIIFADEGFLSLVRIQANKDAELADLPLFGLTVYEKLYTSEGDLFLVAAASSVLQKELIQKGYLLDVLDPDSSNAIYSLLYGSSEKLEQARRITKILLIEGRFGIARTADSQIEHLAALGLQIAPLAPRPFIPNLPEIRTEALPSTVSVDPLIQSMIDQVSQTALFNFIGGLSGEWPVTVNGSPYSIATRYSFATTPINKATRYAYEFFNSLGLTTWYDYYSLSGLERRSVIAQQTGSSHPEKIVLLIAHLDSTSYLNGDPFIFSPGADDNASGSAALMHIAEILSQYEFGCTLRYALFTGEEQGMYGSKAYAFDVYHQGEAIQAVLDLDMLGYNSPSSPAIFELHTRPGNPGDLAIANLFRDVVYAYGFNLVPWILQDGKSFSDHSSFWDYGYPAVMAIEDWNDHTPNYHKTGDQLETLNFSYYVEFVKAAMATFANMGCIQNGRLSGTIRDSLSSIPIPGAKIEALSDEVPPISTTSGSDGGYLLTLQPGTYAIHFSAYDHLGASFNNTTIQQNQTTTIDPFLTPCVFVRQTHLEADTVMPAVGDTVTLNGSVEGGDPPIGFDWDFDDGTTASGASVSHIFYNRGAYLVRLTANNPCGVSQSVSTVFFVDLELVFLPIARLSSAP